MPPFPDDWLPEDEEGSYSEDYDRDYDREWLESQLPTEWPDD